MARSTPGKPRSGKAVLGAAAALIEERGYCSGANARNADGRKVSPFDAEAVSFDACGAMLVVGREASGYAFVDALHAFAQAVGVFGFEDAKNLRDTNVPARTRAMCEKVWEWEDAPGRTAEHVLSAFKRAREYA